MAFPSCDSLKRGLKPVDFRYFRTGSNTKFPLHQKLHMHTLKVEEWKGEAGGHDALWREKSLISSPSNKPLTSGVPTNQCQLLILNQLPCNFHLWL